MPAFAAFLRGINVGGHRVSGAELCQAFAELGFDEVSTFRASGNVVFSSADEPGADQIERALEAALGYAVPVFLRTAAEVRAIGAHEPFPREQVAASNGKLQVSLLLEAPAQAARSGVLGLATEQDRLAFGERELYWLPSGGTLESELDWKAIDELVGVSTRRTKGTIEQIAAKYFAVEG